MNLDESSGPNGSITSMPDHSYMPGDFQNYSGIKSPVLQSPTGQSPNNSLHLKGDKDKYSPQNTGMRPRVHHSRGGSRVSDINSNKDQESRIEGDSYVGGVRERRNNTQSRRGTERRNRSNSDTRSDLHANFSPNIHDELSEVEIDQSYKTFLKLKRLYVYWIFNIICIIVMILNICFAYSTDKIHFNYLEMIESQFNSHLVIDMNLVERGSECNGLYSDAMMGKLNGYENLCQCSTTLHKGKCTKAQLSEGCHAIGPTSPFDVTYWNGKKICMRRSEGSVKEYYQKLTVNNAGEGICEGELKKCIVSSNGNSICMGRFEFCPITKILIEGTSNESSNKKWKGQLHFKDRTFLFENEENKGTSLLDLIVFEDQCEFTDQKQKDECEAKTFLLDRLPESQLLKDNPNNLDRHEELKGFTTSIGLYGKPAQFLEMCKFNKTFNPVILDNELGNWDRVKTLRFVNPFFLCSLLVLSFVRTSVLDYLNTRTSSRVLLRRKKELYNIFGIFTGSSVMITSQVLIILYYIFWGYLLLNQSRLIGQRWLDMTCITEEMRQDTEKMISEISKIEAYNMVTIGPMIICCILEALFAQYKMIDIDIMNQLRE